MVCKKKHRDQKILNGVQANASTTKCCQSDHDEVFVPESTNTFEC